MKQHLIRLVSAVMMTAMFVSVGTGICFAAEEKTTGASGETAVTGESTPATEEELSTSLCAAYDSSISSSENYSAYLAAHSGAAKPDEIYRLQPEDAFKVDEVTGKPVLGQLAMVNAGPKNSDDTRSGVLTTDEGITGWQVSIKTSGFYNMTFSYFAYDTITYVLNGQTLTATSKSAAVQRKIYIDGTVPFYEARQVDFERVWKDSGLLRVDTETGNEKRPYQEESAQWETLDVRDYQGYINGPLCFYLEAGTHVIALEAVREGMVIEGITLHQVEAVPTYAELKASYDAQGYKAAEDNNVVFVQAEGLHDEAAYSGGNDVLTLSSADIEAYKNYVSPSITTEYNAAEDVTYRILKSSPTIYAISERSSPQSVPYHYSKIRYNTVGGEKWEDANQWIQWEVEVPEDGLYTISFRARQNTLNGMYTCRTLYINGKQPCRETENIIFPYSNSFSLVTVGGEDGAYQFHLNKGTNIIRLETSLGQMGELLSRAQTIVNELNSAYRKILVFTSANPDTNKDYQLDKVAPQALEILATQNENLNALQDEFIEIYGKGVKAQMSSVQQMLLLLERMVEDHNRIKELFTNFQSSIAAMGTWINNLSVSPLELDYVVIAPENNVNTTKQVIYPTVGGSEKIIINGGFFSKALHEIRSFIASFTEDYDNIGGTVEDGNQKPVEIWLETGAGLTGSRDNATILKQLIDDLFTAKTGISVSTRLVASGSLLPATIAGIGPDLCLSRSAENAVNYAFRGAVMNLANDELFGKDACTLEHVKELDAAMGEDETHWWQSWQEVLQDRTRFASSAVGPFTFGSGIFAVPETQSFYMTFYRTDILDELGVEAPDTWDDVYDLIKELQNQSMTFAMPVPVNGVVGSGNLTYAMLLYQNGGSYYTDDRSTTELSSDAALDAFKTWTEFYTLYNLPNSYDFVNRFRSGEVPIGIASYATYSNLAVFAPEISGVWEFSLVPGTMKKDSEGNTFVDRSCASSTSGCIMMNTDMSDPEAKTRVQRAWTFMNWWTGEDAQYRFGTEIESLLGEAARYETANLKAFERLPWDKNSMKTIREQWDHAKCIPEAPGGYFTARNIEFAWKEVTNNSTDPNTTFMEYVSKINQEIARKREEFQDKIDALLS